MLSRLVIVNICTIHSGPKLHLESEKNDRKDISCNREKQTVERLLF